MRELSDARREFYTNVMNTCRAEYDELHQAVDNIVSRVRERVDALNRDKDAVLMIHAGACRMLGVLNEFEEVDELAEEAPVADDGGPGF